MDISRSHAVDIFKKHSGLWYEWAQKFPIAVYKDILLFHEFAHSIVELAHQWHDQQELINTIQERSDMSHLKNYDNERFGPFIELTERCKIAQSDIKSFLQSALLDTTTITYQTYDELSVYSSGYWSSIAMIVCQIIGCAPPWYPYIKAIGEWLRIIHMITNNTTIQNYIPAQDLIMFHVEKNDFDHCRMTHRINDSMKKLVEHYITQYETLCLYGIKWVTYINPAWRDWALQIIRDYEEYVELIKKYDYNIFHPCFRPSFGKQMIWYLLYWISYFRWKK